MFETPPSPEELARWLLAFESHQDHGSMDPMVGLEHAYARLQAGLTVYFGKTGFESLWTRAMFRAQITFPLSVAPQEMPLPARQSTPASLHGHATIPEGDIPLLALTSFISLLFSFVGADLGSRLIYQVWPQMPLGNSNLPTGATTL